MTALTLLVLRRVSAHFGKDPREYSISTKEFVSDGNGKIKGINTVRVAWEKDALGQWRMSEVPGSEQFFPADLYVPFLSLRPATELMSSASFSTVSSSLSVSSVLRIARSRLSLSLKMVDQTSRRLSESTLPLLRVSSLLVIADEDNPSLFVSIQNSTPRQFDTRLTISFLALLGGINEGRGAAAEVDRYLTGDTRLPNVGSIKVRT